MALLSQKPGPIQDSRVYEHPQSQWQDHFFVLVFFYVNRSSSEGSGEMFWLDCWVQKGSVAATLVVIVQLERLMLLSVNSIPSSCFK